MGQTEVIYGFGTPIEQPFQAFQKNQFLGSISPIIRYPIESMSGYQFFRGKPTSDVIDATYYKNAPQVIKDFIGYSEYQGKTKEGKTYTSQVSLRPERMNMLNNLPAVGRILSTISDIEREDKDTGMKTLKLLTGIQTKGIDFELEEKRREDELKLKIEELLLDAGIRGKFTRFYDKK